ncbi:hypothetical protein F5Y14DRAFT_453693 [Nemania sp. NC0429]|nr:hypothetical protein F5Y14DRAFT_453693 [Nemania sp. NC0429]
MSDSTSSAQSGMVSKGVGRRNKINWEEHHDKLYELYIVENKPLPEVMKYMEEKHHFHASVKQCMSMSITLVTHHRYQLGEIWEWKKYNQGRKKSSLPGIDMYLDRNSPSHCQDDTIAERQIRFNASGQEGTAPLHTQLFDMFINEGLEKRSLGILEKCKPQDGLRCIQRCWDWCHEKIHNDASQTPTFSPPAGMETVEEQYAWDARLFIYLLHHYFVDTDANLGRPDWASIAKTLIKFSPIKMLFAMGSLMVTMASSTFDESSQMASVPAPDNELGIAELSAKGMRMLGRDELMAQFCCEFEDNLKDFTGYAAAFRYAVRVFQMQNANVAEQYYYEDPWCQKWAEDDVDTKS